MPIDNKFARRIAVIGAGAAGLCTAKHLLASGVEVVIYELGSYVGGLWVYENDNGLGPAYKSLHLNSEARVTAYRDFPFPPEAPIYPGHAEVRQYLEAYAIKFDLRPKIRFNSQVANVAPKDGRWIVRLEDGRSEIFDAVVVASGHQGTPTHPAWKDEFTGNYLHSHTYRVPEPFRDQRVLVVGMGNSAVDIASDICVVTQATVISSRSPVLVMPRMLFGVPTSRVLGKLEKPWMPWPVRRTIREVLTRIVHGSMEQWGFTTPKTRTHPTSHHNLMSQFVWNRIRAKPGIKSVKGQEISFTDGTSETFDTVIAGTGYAVTLPFLQSELLPLNGHKLELFLRVVHPGQSGLYFTGMFNVAGGGNIRMMDDQAEWIAALVSNTEGLPNTEQMKHVMQEEENFLARHYPGSSRYALELDPTFYRKMLSRARRQGQVHVRTGTQTGKTT